MPTLAPERINAIGLMARTVADQATHDNERYAAIRPQTIPSVYRGVTQKLELDCSDGCRFIARVAGVKDDPAGNSYGPYGNSESIWAHLHHILLTESEPGDIVTFGYTSGEHHACMLHSRTANGWIVWNMGTQGQPILTPLASEIAGHAGMTLTVCRLNVVDPPPTRADLLRAHKTYYSWIAWTLGEGPWKHYGRKNRSVRPSVRRVIPAKWWKAYAGFLLRRKKGNP